MCTMIVVTWGLCSYFIDGPTNNVFWPRRKIQYFMEILDQFSLLDTDIGVPLLEVEQNYRKRKQKLGFTFAARNTSFFSYQRLVCFQTKFGIVHLRYCSPRESTSSGDDKLTLGTILYRRRRSQIEQEKHRICSQL